MAVDYSLPSWIGPTWPDLMDKRRAALDAHRKSMSDQENQKQTQQRDKERESDEHAESLARTKAMADKVAADRTFADRSAQIDSNDPNYNQKFWSLYAQVYGANPTIGAAAMRGAMAKPAITPTPNLPGYQPTPGQKQWPTLGDMISSRPQAGPAGPAPLIWTGKSGIRNPTLPAPLDQGGMVSHPQAGPAGPAPLLWKGSTGIVNPALAAQRAQAALDLRAKSEQDRMAQSGAALAERVGEHKDTEADKAAALKDREAAHLDAHTVAMLSLLQRAKQSAEKSIAALKTKGLTGYIVEYAGEGKSADEAKKDYETDLDAQNASLAEANAQIGALNPKGAPAATAPPSTGKKWVYDPAQGSLVPAAP